MGEECYAINFLSADICYIFNIYNIIYFTVAYKDNFFFPTESCAHFKYDQSVFERTYVV